MTHALTKAICISPSTWLFKVCTKYLSLTLLVKALSREMDPVLFVISVVVTVCGHLFEIYTIVAEIHEGFDLVFGIKNVTVPLSS